MGGYLLEHPIKISWVVRRADLPRHFLEARVALRVSEFGLRFALSALNEFGHDTDILQNEEIC
jgi:hypothetical protein